MESVPIGELANEVSTVPSLFKRTILFVDVPLYVVNHHPTTIFPSFCKAKARTSLSHHIPIAKVVSMVPSALRRMILFAVVPLYVVNHHPISIAPSD